jgi:signal transduction histidine kinase
MRRDGRELLGRTLSDITQLLESADRSNERVRRVLEILHTLVPYEQCVMLDLWLGHEPHIEVVSHVPPFDQVPFMTTLVDLFQDLAAHRESAAGPASPFEGMHLAMPMVGLDEVMGLLFVRSSLAEYTEDHVRALSLVAAKLAAYFTMLHAQAQLAQLALERDEARRAAEAANRAKDQLLVLVSDEIKTRLRSIWAWADILGSTTDDAERARAIDEIEVNVRGQVRLIDDVLDLAGIASPELVKETRPGDKAN